MHALVRLLPCPCEVVARLDSPRRPRGGIKTAGMARLRAPPWRAQTREPQTQRLRAVCLPLLSSAGVCRRLRGYLFSDAFMVRLAFDSLVNCPGCPPPARMSGALGVRGGQ